MLYYNFINLFHLIKFSSLFYYFLKNDYFYFLFKFFILLYCILNNNSNNSLHYENIKNRYKVQSILIFII